MPASPENTERLKKVALTGIGLALAGMALKHNKIIGKKIRHASLWPGSETESFIVDVVGDIKEKSVRLAGLVIRDANNEIVDVDLENDDLADEAIIELEAAFPPEPEQAEQTS